MLLASKLTLGCYNGARGVPGRPGIRRDQFADEADAVAVARSDADRKVWPAHAGGPACIAWTELDSKEHNVRVIMVYDHPAGWTLLNTRTAE